MTRCFPSASLEMRASREIREFLCLYVIKLHPMNVEGEEEEEGSRALAPRAWRVPILPWLAVNVSLQMTMANEHALAT